MKIARIPGLGNEAQQKGARAARSNLIYRDGHPPPEARHHANAGMQCSSPLFSVSQRAPQRRQGTHSFLLPSFRPHLRARLHVLIGSPASDPGGCALRCDKYVAARGLRPVEITSQTLPTMDNKPNFGERVTLLRETAYKLREAAEIVLAEVQHMEAAAQFNRVVTAFWKSGDLSGSS